MRVLNVNKYYYLRGGAERYYFQLGRLLENRGHQVIPFSMRGGRNAATRFEDYFVSEIDFVRPPGWLDRAKASLRVLYSVEARRKVEQLIRDTRPQVAHLHNIAHQLSPSIIGPMRSSGMRVVQTLHDYKLVCPTYRFYRDGRVCEECRRGGYWEALRRRCNRGSWTASLVNALEMTLHHGILGSYRNVDAFVAPSRFLGEKVVEFGIPREKVVHLPYYLDLSEFQESRARGDHLLYVGRLSEEKGLVTLVRAMRSVDGMSLVILGEGPMEPILRRESGGLPSDRIRFGGYLSGEALLGAVARARCVIVPSEWYENSPLTIYEAFALGRPVVGSRIGGIPELVIDGRTGLLFEPGDAEGLAGCLQRLIEDPNLARALGREARSYVEELADPERHLGALGSIYGDAVL